MTDAPSRVSPGTSSLLPCPFCGSEISHVESLAKSFKPPLLYHEWHHPKNDCWVSRLTRIVESADEDPERQAAAALRWNTRCVAQPQPHTGTKEAVLDALDEFARTKSASGGYAVDNQVIDRFLGEAREHLAVAIVQPQPWPSLISLETVLNFARCIPDNVDDATGLAYAPFSKLPGTAASLTAGALRALLAASPPQPHDHIGKYAADYSPVTPEEIAKDDPELLELYANSRPVQAVAGECVCQNQHRRGYCTEPGCPYAMSSTPRASPIIEPVESVGMRGAVKQALDDHASMIPPADGGPARD